MKLTRVQLQPIHDALITGLQALGEIERVQSSEESFPKVHKAMLAHDMAPIHPTGKHEIGTFCEALRYVHEAIFAEEQA